MIFAQCCGVDMAKDKFDACFSVLTEGMQVKNTAKRQFSNSPAGFKQFGAWLERWDKANVPVTVNMEATGVYHEGLAWYLHHQSRPVSIMLPNRAKHFLRAMGHDSKNDKADAQGLAHIGLRQPLRLWEPCSAIFRQLRCLTREHQALQEQRTAISNRLHALSYQRGLPKSTTLRLKKQCGMLQKQAKAVLKEIQQTLQQDKQLWQKAGLLMSIPSVGLLTVATVLAETDGFALIGSAAQPTSYAGYDVLERQSGTSKGKTRISKKGNAHIRRILHFPALNTVRYGDGFFKAFHKRLTGNGKTNMQAFVALQRKLLALMWTLWKKNEPFQADFHQQQQTKKIEGGKEGDQEKTNIEEQKSGPKGLPSNHKQGPSFGSSQQREKVKNREQALTLAPACCPAQDGLAHANKRSKPSFG